MYSDHRPREAVYLAGPRPGDAGEQVPQPPRPLRGRPGCPQAAKRGMGALPQHMSERPGLFRHCPHLIHACRRLLHRPRPGPPVRRGHRGVLGRRSAARGLPHSGASSGAIEICVISAKTGLCLM